MMTIIVGLRYPAIGEQTIFSSQSVGQLCIGQSVEQTDQANRNRGVLDATDHGFRNSALLSVKTHNEPCGHEHTRVIDFVNGLDEAAPNVLLLLYGQQSVRVWSLYTNEHDEKIGLPHHCQQF